MKKWKDWKYNQRSLEDYKLEVQSLDVNGIGYAKIPSKRKPIGTIARIFCVTVSANSRLSSNPGCVQKSFALVWRKCHLMSFSWPLVDWWGCVQFDGDRKSVVILAILVSLYWYGSPTIIHQNMSGCICIPSHNRHLHRLNANILSDPTGIHLR